MSRRERGPGTWFGILAFVAVALLPIALSWAAWSRDVAADPVGWLQYAFLPAIPRILLPLSGAALLLRHPAAHRHLPLVLFGAVLLAVEALAQDTAGLAREAIDAAVPPDPFLPGPSMAVIGYSLLVSIIGTFGFLYLARGLRQARSIPDGGAAKVMPVIVLILAVGRTAATIGAAGATWASTTDPMTLAAIVVAIGAGTLSVLAVGYLAIVATRGWVDGEAPLLGWGLAALGGWVTMTAIAIGTAVELTGFGIGTTASDIVLTVLTVTGPLAAALFVLAFLVGLPASEDISWHDLADIDPFEDDGAGG